MGETAPNAGNIEIIQGICNSSRNSPGLIRIIMKILRIFLAILETLEYQYFLILKFEYIS